MKVVIDTNVVISAVLKGRNPRKVVQWVTDTQDVAWIVSEAILTEYRQVLNRKKFDAIAALRQEWFEIFAVATCQIEVDVEINFPRDRKDAKFLACAVAAQADFLITGDKDFEDAQQLLETQIVTVAEFENWFCE